MILTKGIEIKYVVFIFLVCFVGGCQRVPSPKIYDWSKTLSEQKLKEGDPIIVEGVAKNILPYTYDKRVVIGDYTRSAGFKLDASPTEITIFLMDPDSHVLDRITESPSSIGAVVGTIYNPMFNRDIARLLGVYPFSIPIESKEVAETNAYIENITNKEVKPSSHKLRLSQHLNIRHRFQIKGIIQGFQRRTYSGMMSDISMQCIDIAISEITLIE